MVLCTGGMSVDPDDMTPSAIKESGAQIISYGAPVLPGGDVPAWLFFGWNTGYRTARMRDVCKSDHF